LLQLLPPLQLPLPPLLLLAVPVLQPLRLRVPSASKMEFNLQEHR
jgi:hypothetical protein